MAHVVMLGDESWSGKRIINKINNDFSMGVRNPDILSQ
jgi:hypothetical protein